MYVAKYPEISEMATALPYFRLT